MVATFGIVNLTRDSFSDGGRYQTAGAALAHAEQLVTDGADVIDLGAESTHPDAETVDGDEELRRLLPVLRPLVARGIAVSIDTWKPEVMRSLWSEGAMWWNDVSGMRSPAALAAVQSAPAHVRFVAMFARNHGPRAERANHDAEDVLAEVRAFCRDRIATFAGLGIARERLVLDPGMGFFLGRAPAASLRVLGDLAALQREFGPLLVSVSRKSFLGTVTGEPVAARGPATLAAELWAARAGVSWLRTHDVRAFRAAWAIERAIATSG